MACCSKRRRATICAAASDRLEDPDYRLPRHGQLRAILRRRLCAGRQPIGGKEGQGFYQLMNTYEAARIQTAARGVGVAQAAYECAVKYAKERTQFGVPIGNHQVIRHKLAHMAVDIEAGRQLAYFAASQKDTGKRCDYEAGLAKVFAAEMAEKVTREAMQVHGGYGYSMEFNAQRFWRDARVLSIFEGTSEIQLEVIGRRIMES